MFESAITAAESAARQWTPERPEPAGGASRCCGLCLRRYRLLVLNGPLRMLPHGVAHAAVAVVDDVIATRMAEVWERSNWDAWAVLLREEDREAELSRRQREARGALMLVALEELAHAEPRLEHLHARYTEPAFAAFLACHRVDEIPQAWLD